MNNLIANKGPEKMMKRSTSTSCLHHQSSFSLSCYEYCHIDCCKNRPSQNELRGESGLSTGTRKTLTIGGEASEASVEEYGLFESSGLDAITT